MSEAPARSPLPRVDAALAVGLGTLALVVLSGRVLWPDLKWSVWSDRDMTRALELWQHPQTSGAELNAGLGARIPGGAQYALMNVLGLGADDPLRYQRGVHLADLGGAVLLAVVAHRLAGRWAAAIVLALHASAPSVVDTLREVWNPALTPPLACASVAALAAAIAAPSARAAVAWCALCALGAQVHLSWLPWTAAGTALIAVAGAPGRARTLALGACVAVAAYAPFLASELRDGAPQLALMNAQAFARHVGGDGGWTPQLAGTARVLAWLSSSAKEPGAALTLDTRAAVVLAGLVAAVALAATLRTRRAVAAASVGGASVATVALMVGDPSLPFFVRYFVVAEPALALTAAVGLAGAARAAGRITPSLAAVLHVIITAALVTVVTPYTKVWSEPREDDLVVLERDIAAIERATGWSTEAQAGRIVRVARRADDPPWRAFDGIDYLLRRDGSAFPGSSLPPCALWLRETVTPDEVPAILARVLPPAHTVSTVRAHHPLPSGATLVVYDGVSRCPTSLVDRYVGDPAFADVARTALAPAPVGQVSTRSIPGGQRWYVNLPLPSRTVDDAALTRVHVFVDLVRDAGGWRATLRSEQLRGETHLRGWFATGLLHAPTLRLVPDVGMPVDIPFSTSFVGVGGASTPLSVDVALAPGRARAVLRADVHPRREEGDPPPQPDAGVPVEVVLGEVSF